MRKTLMAISFCNGTDERLLIRTKQDDETIKELLADFKKSEKYNGGEYSDDDIIEFMQKEYDDIESVDTYPTFIINFCNA